MRVELGSGLPAAVLRTLTVQDAQAFADHVRSDLARLSEFLPWPARTQTTEGARAWLQPYGDGRDGRLLVAGVEVEGALVGGVVLFHHDAAMATAEIGCWVVGAASGKGVARAACLEALRLARDLGVKRVAWHCDPRNLRSRALAERIGFVFEGTLRSSYVVRGERLDTDVLSLVGQEIDRALA